MDDRILTKNDIKITKGKKYLPCEWFAEKSSISYVKGQKVVVFDLDETLGSFADLYILWRGVKKVWNQFDNFTNLLDLFPEFLRYGILTILEYLYYCKTKGICDKIFLYTNNQCSVTWVKLICSYIETKIRDKFPNSDHILFDQFICAFKINNRIVEPLRTSHKKSLNDFFQCTRLSTNANICYIDDVDYPSMKGSTVYYICPRIYIHTLNTKTIIQRIVKTDWQQYNTLLQSKEFWNSWFLINKRKMVRRGNPDITIDLQISRKMIHHLSEFLNFEQKKHVLHVKTKKNRKLTTRRTRKIIC